MTGEKFDPARYNTSKWAPTPTPWANWPVAKDPEAPNRRGRRILLVVIPVVLAGALWWPPLAFILGVCLAVSFIVGG